MQNFQFKVEKTLLHYGMCDASAAVAIDQERFLVGNDEDNILRVYSAQTSGKPLHSIDINSYFPEKDPKDEIDIEASAELDGIIYWITSHGRNKKAKFKPERHQFFANKIAGADQPNLKQFGKSYTQLVLNDILETEKLSQYNFAKAEKIAPKQEGGLNIEGLTTTPEGKLLIGFRNPLPQGKALLLPLLNFRELIDDNNNTTAQFGNMIELDLDGLGIRSIEYWQTYQVYLIVSGDYAGGNTFALYWWSGNKQEQPEKIESLDLPEQFRPESILFYPHKPSKFQMLSDDGSIKRVGDQECKDIEVEDDNNPNHEHKYFRSVWVSVSNN